MLNIIENIRTEIIKDSKVISYGRRMDSVNGYREWKNVFDRLAAFVIVVVLSPLMLVIAVAIRLDSKGSSIYKREQIGENGRRFVAYKFRTMYVNNNDSEYKQYLVKYIKENAPYRNGPDGKPVYKVD